MFKFNDLIKEIKNIPDNRLDEVYEFIHALNKGKKKNSSNRKKILSFAGSFSDMSEKDYTAFLSETKNTRTLLFNRNV